MPGDNPLPPDRTLRASLGLHLDQALSLTPSDLSCALGISMVQMQQPCFDHSTELNSPAPPSYIHYQHTLSTRSTEHPTAT